ncbi:hypothetical protein CB1_020217001 [Camelus ferus]|nr:hypothetical protein CB1_020217001 [Camelus ferus]
MDKMALAAFMKACGSVVLNWGKDPYFISGRTVIGTADEEAMNRVPPEHSSEVVGIVFSDTFSYQLKFSQRYRFPIIKEHFEHSEHCRGLPDEVYCSLTRYWKKGFVAFQTAINAAIIEIALAFLLSVLIKKPFLTSLVGFLFTVFWGGLGFFVLYRQLPLSLAWALGLFSPFAFTAGMAQISHLDYNLSGVVFPDPSGESHIMIVMYFVLVFDTLLYLILTLYFERVLPGSTTIYNTQLSEITKMEEIRKDIGFCPQFNIQFDFLTVRENLRLFAKIKGIQPEEVEQEVKRVIMELDIENFQDVIAKKLSGGQKRKLTFGIALLGDPQVLLLDEPTAGLDPFSRHRVWNFLKEYKTNHVILFSTQFMDEADILADLFRDLEKSSDQGIMNYGISMTTLNEVYLNLKDKSAVDEPDLGIQRQEEICVTRGTEIESEMEQALCSLPEMKKAINSGTLWRRQICAMARLRFLKLRRERKILLSLLVVFGIVLIPVICEKIMFVVFHHTHRWEFSSSMYFLSSEQLPQTPLTSLLIINNTGSNIEDLVQSLKRQDIVLEVDDFRNRNGSDDPSYNGAIIVSGDHKVSNIAYCITDLDHVAHE